MASTRPLIEIGLMDPRKQIDCGRTVAPKLLITLGISGAVQFAAGMKGSQVVFSVCNDKMHQFLILLIMVLLEMFLRFYLS